MHNGDELIACLSDILRKLHDHWHTEHDHQRDAEEPTDPLGSLLLVIGKKRRHLRRGLPRMQEDEEPILPAHEDEDEDDDEDDDEDEDDGHKDTLRDRAHS